MKFARHLPAAFLVCITACGGSATAPALQSGAPSNPPSDTHSAPTYDLDALGPPHFVTAPHIDPSQLDRVSMFRSGVGHDYHDALESCRSMKHYFAPRSRIDWSTVVISSPIAGTIVHTEVEQTFGTQMWIVPAAYPAFKIILFHVKPLAGMDSGAVVTAGQQIGTHIGSQTMSDVAIGVNTPSGYRLVSWFDVITDDLLAAYQAHGILSRASAILTKAQRDAAPLACTGEAFTSPSTLADWTAFQ